MDLHSIKERFTEYTVLSAIIAVVLLVFAILIGLTTSVEADFSVSGMTLLLKHNPVFWFIIAFAVLLPLTVYWITSNFTKRLFDKQKIINNEQDRIDQVNEFAHQLIHNNLDAEFKLSGENDALGESLINLRNTLKSNYENNLKLRKEEEQRNWIAEGSAHFSEILRNYTHDLEQLSFNVIKDLTKYVNAIQGGFYLLEDSDPYNRYFNLTAFFAYDRRKFTDQKIKWGDGLIGTCALEQKIIHLKRIPESYITVTSGLGEANPDNLMVVPMIYEEQIYGVLELASFGKFEPNHISLIEKTAESVASTLSTVKTNLKTGKLLEESKAQTQTLTSHDEEMRQNMEELQATQEEAMRQSQRLVLLEDTLKQNFILAEFDTEGRLISANSLFYSKFEYSNEPKIEGKNISELINEENREWFNQILNSLLRENKSYKGYIKHVTRTGKDLWTMASISNAMNEDKTIEKIMFLGIDVSEERDQLMKQETIVESINNTGVKLELDINGNLLECNKNFTDLFKLSQKDIKSLVLFDIINPIELEAFNKQWDAIIKGNSFTGILRTKTARGDEIWLNGSTNSIQNMSHEIDRIIFVGTNITHEKRMEMDLSVALETLKKQEKLIKDSEKELVNKLRETKSELLNQFKEIEKIKNLNEKMLEDSPDAVITTSHDNRIVFFNKAAELLWQLNRSDVLDQDISILFPETLTEKDELLGSFTRPGDHKITGKRKKSIIIDKNGKEKQVLIMLTKARIDNENAYMAFIQHNDK
jgi:PAS domain S-box-containing protein